MESNEIPPDCFLEHFGVPYDEEKGFYWYKKLGCYVEKIKKTALYESKKRLLENE